MKMGSDNVIFNGELVIIEARHEIRDWSVREFSRIPIYLGQQRYYLRRKVPAEKPYAFRYELAPWPEHLHEQSSLSFSYDEAFVAKRDEAARGEKRVTLAWYLLLPLYPFLGFCWSGFKERVLQPIGFVSTEITSASTMLTFCLVLCDLIFVGYFGGGIITALHGRGVMTIAWLLDLAFAGFLLLDCVVRYSQVIRNDEVPDGFYEWFFKRLRRG